MEYRIRIRGEGGTWDYSFSGSRQEAEDFGEEILTTHNSDGSYNSLSVRERINEPKFTRNLAKRRKNDDDFLTEWHES